MKSGKCIHTQRHSTQSTEPKQNDTQYLHTESNAYTTLTSEFSPARMPAPLYRATGRDATVCSASKGSFIEKYMGSVGAELGVQSRGLFAATALKYTHSLTVQCKDATRYISEDALPR
jgi:hypothetical protein